MSKGISKNLARAYSSDASMIKGSAKNVEVPKNISEVQKIIRENSRIVPRGSGTGFSGGAIPLDGQDTVISLINLEEISNLDKERKTVEVEAGVILENLENYLIGTNLIFPVSPSSRDICTIGGMIATNASDKRAGVYGKISNWIKWVDVVDGKGNINRKGITEISDYAGLEGITGVIVKACLKLSPLRQRTASLIKVISLDEIISISKHLKRNPLVSMIEFFDIEISKMLGFGENYTLVVEYEDESGIIKGEEYEKIMNLIDKVYILASVEEYTRIEDVKVQLDRFHLLMEFLIERRVPLFGSLSAGLLHPCFNERTEEIIPEMIKKIPRIGGQISGRFGIGLLKKEFVEFNDKRILSNVKNRCDPENKFNVGKIL